MRTFGLVLGAFICLGACTIDPATGEGGVYNKQHAYVDENGQEMICERVDVPGSIFPDRVCMTSEAWERQKQAAKDATGDVHRKGLATPAPGQGG